MLYKVTGARNDRMVNMARTIDRPGWCEIGTARLSGQLIALRAFEAEAVKIGGVHLVLVPGLLQTPN